MKKPLFLLIMLMLPFAFAKSIDISLAAAPSPSVTELSVTNTQFDWSVNEDKVCTSWAVKSSDSGSTQKQCFGSSSCCSLISMQPSSAGWDDTFALTKGKLGATSNNVATAQVIYADYSLDINNPFSDIVYSSAASTPVIFQSAAVSASSPSMNVRVFHGTGTTSVQQLTPADNSYFNAADDVNLDFFVFHPSGTTVNCDLLVDNGPIWNIVNSQQTDTISLPSSFGEGIRKVKLACTDSQGTAASSGEKNLIMDYTWPQSTLLTIDNALSFKDTITLNYTVTDNLAPESNCQLYVGGIEKASFTAKNGVTQSMTLSELANGTYAWNITCTDAAKNGKSSEQRKFHIDLNQAFGLTLSGTDFDIGQYGYYIITAPFGADATVLITEPNGNSFFRYYNGAAFPVIGEIDFTTYPGSYKVDAVLTYNNGVQQIAKTFNVKNSFTTSIEATSSLVAPGTTITFTGYTNGGIGDKTYQWKVDDVLVSSEKTFNRAFDAVGDFRVSFSATDSKGNTAGSNIIVHVKNSYTLEITVLNAADTPLADALVFIDGEKKQAGEGGKVSLPVIEGSHDILITKPSYTSLSDEIDVTQDVSTTYTLEALGKLDLTKKADEQKTPEGFSPAEVVSTPDSGDFNTHADALIDRITSALYEIDNLDTNSLEAASLIKIEEIMQEAKTDLLRAKRDFDGLKFIQNDEERAKRRLDIESAISDIEENTVIGISAHTIEEYAATTEDSHAEELLQRFFTLKKITGSKSILKPNLELQKSLTVLRTIIPADVTLLSGATKSITVVLEKITLHDSNTNILLLESFPKDIAKDVKEISFSSKFETLEADPIVLYDPASSKEITYTLPSLVDPEATKKIAIIAVNPLVEEKQKQGITGFAIFSTLSKIEDPMLVIQIALIVLLLIVYIFYEFEILLKIRQHDVFQKINPATYISGMLNKDMKQIRDLLKKAQGEIKKEELQNAEDTYHDLIKIYNDKLNSNQRKKTIDQISSVYNELLVHRILKKTREIEPLAASDRNKAKQAYNKMQELYSQLPKSWKIRVSKECNKAYLILAK